VHGKEWRLDGIAPGDVVDERRRWTLDDRIEVVALEGLPVVAWAEFPDPGSAARLVGTYHLSEYGRVSLLRAWTLPPAGATAPVPAEFLGREGSRRHFHATEHPPAPTAAPVLRDLYAAATAQDRSPRIVDPMGRLLNTLLDLAASTDAERSATELRSIVHRLSRRDIDELLVRLAIEYGHAPDVGAPPRD
jgi:hypothetical protein